MARRRPPAALREEAAGQKKNSPGDHAWPSPGCSPSWVAARGGVRLNWLSGCSRIERAARARRAASEGALAKTLRQSHEPARRAGRSADIRVRKDAPLPCGLGGRVFSNRFLAADRSRIGYRRPMVANFGKIQRSGKVYGALTFGRRSPARGGLAGIGSRAVVLRGKRSLARNRRPEQRPENERGWRGREPDGLVAAE